ncbi:MAG: purine nucleoside phosphorylase [Deltaproteobacteria bacterium SG8_13]|nr:MAG: purine nucleoside phosphorylase [Deltaproteobacteria bacterium SG8_13]
MKNDKHRAEDTAGYLRRQVVGPVEIGIFTGTGLGGSVGFIRVDTEIAYRDLPFFPVSTVPGHAGKMLFGRLKDRHVMVMQGRFHLYEGYSAREVTFPIRVMQELGVKVLIVTNAAGGLTARLQAGDIMVIRDHINLTGDNPLVGENEESWGVRFPDMSGAYDADLAQTAGKAGRHHGMEVKSGVYAGLKGPSLETPAEVRFLKTIGADAVGFSTVQEVIAAVHARMRVLGLSIITNINDPDAPMPATVEEIIATAEAAAPRLEKLLQTIVEQFNDKP